MARRSTAVIGITGGDPCGIGPEVLLKALPVLARTIRSPLVIVGDEAMFHETAKRLRLGRPSWHVVTSKDRWTGTEQPVTFLDCGHRLHWRPGHASREAGRASLDYLDRAVALWRARRIHALVTAPVTKWAIERSTPRFVGQTEYLAEAMGRQEVAMMFVSDQLRVVLLTRHLPLREVPRAVTPSLIRTTVRLTLESLRTQFLVKQPRMVVCGLNPHAGEGGLFGREEQRVLLPVLRELRARGIACDGPVAADGFFAKTDGYDAVICWYHDQGLIPFKMAARDRGCQLTVGLPIVRTSPDHGSALDIAGRGIADAGSMMYALKLASRLAMQRVR